MTAAPSLALDGWQVLVVRPGDRGDDLAAELQRHGARALRHPLIETIAETESPAMRSAVAGLAAGTYDWLAVTSAAGVDALVDTAAAVGSPLTIAPRTRVAAVGPATARALEAAGARVDLVPAAHGSASAMVAAWPAEPPGSRVLLPRSDLAGRALPDALLAAGHLVDEVCAYRTEIRHLPEEVAESLRRGEITAVVFTSPSAVHAFAASFPGARDGTAVSSLLVAIGQPTADAMGDAGLSVAAVAADPTAHGIVAALRRLRSAAPHRYETARDSAGPNDTGSAT